MQVSYPTEIGRNLRDILEYFLRKAWPFIQKFNGGYSIRAVCRCDPRRAIDRERAKILYSGL